MRGFFGLRLAVIAHPVGAKSLDVVEAKADRALFDNLEQFTLPANADASARSAASSDMVEIPLDTFEAHEFLACTGWTDGLPVVFPTPELVDRMIAGCGRDPEEVIAMLPPRGAAATIRAIATNAVMAGCLPEYLPVILAAVDAVADPIYGLSHRQITTHGGAPLMIVNGPIAERLGINGSTGLFGPGRRANATIGRAMRLVLMNIGGAIPGITDMAQHGHPGKFSYCIAEDEATTPFEPLHVERGFNRADSVVTLVNAEAPHSITDNINTTAREILTTCASTLGALGSNNIYSQGEPILGLGPEHAHYIHADGWQKADIKMYIFESARQPWHAVRGRGKSLGPNFPKWLERPKDDDMVPILTHPDELIVIACGGAGGKSVGIPTAGRQSRSVSRRIIESM